jgi:hypothetical protein
MNRIYIYLAMRSKNGIKVLAIVKGDNHPAMRLKDVHKLGLPQEFAEDISRQIYEDRMLWEPWMESASDYTELKTSLRTRGYNGLPMLANPMFNMNLKSVVSDKEKQREPLIKSIEKPQQTMLRKFSNT